MSCINACRLITLLTSPWDVKNLVEDFLFVLCKENGNKSTLLRTSTRVSLKSCCLLL